MGIGAIAKTSFLSAMPAPLRDQMMLRYRQRAYTRFIREKFADRVRPIGWGEVAPPQLVETEALMDAADIAQKQQRSFYFGSGLGAALRILRSVEEQGAHLPDLRSVLDFGCGSGRVIRHFRAIAGLDLAGTDAIPGRSNGTARTSPVSPSAAMRLSRRWIMPATSST